MVLLQRIIRLLENPFKATADKIVSDINNNEDTNDTDCSDYLNRASRTHIQK
jgi:hypothetical protein